MRCVIRYGWHQERRQGKVLADNVWVEQDWTPVLWDDEEDPCFFKTQGLEFFETKDVGKAEVEQEFGIKVEEE